LEVGLGLARQVHHGEHGDLVAQKLLVEQAAVALDVARLFECAHAAQARRRRDADTARQLHIGHAAVVLQLLENLAIDRIESRGHRRLLALASGGSILTPIRDHAKQSCADKVSRYAKDRLSITKLW